ncbi:MAG TPA: AraC family transcriptional regulator [Acidimicrobiales bacterium]
MEDALSAMLRDVRPQGALFDRTFVTPPWAVRFDDGAPLSLITMLGGEAWLAAGSGLPLRVRPGDVALVRGPDPFQVGDDLGTPPDVVVAAGGRCTTPGGRPLGDRPGVCGGEPGGGASALLTASYQAHGSVCARVLDGLPRAFVVAAGAATEPVAALIDAELARARLGQRAVLDRLLDLLLVSTLRDWLDRPESGAPAWYRALSDPVVGAALRLIHDEPARPWTVAALAREVGASRAAFARRFADLVGEPPMGYLTCWRMCVAADLLRQNDATVGAVARRVGYANAYALSVAFTRVHGVRPSRYRAGVRGFGAPPPASPAATA